jgi:SUKH-4 immunity protein of toxin-antitoxin system
MDLAGEIRRLWGDSLQPETTEIDKAVPERTRAFLSEIGLPTEPLWGLTFAHGAALIPFERAGRQCLPIAGHPGLPIPSLVVDLATEALLQWPFDPSESNPPDVVNADLGLFLLTTGRYLAMLEALHQHDGDPKGHIADLCEAFRRDLAAVDPAAVEAETFWSEMVDEVQGGHDAWR